MAKRKTKKSTQPPKAKKTKQAKKTAGNLTNWLNKLNRKKPSAVQKGLKRFKKQNLPTIKLAQFFIPLSLGLVTFFLGLSLFLPKDQFQLAKERLAENPLDIEARLILVEEFINNNQYQEAERELLLAQNTKKLKNRRTEEQKNVLGIATSKFQKLWQKKQETDPENIRWLISQWEEIISRQPNYRDGYLRLALYHYQLFENQKAQVYLQKALELDPNFEPTQELLQAIQD